MVKFGNPYNIFGKNVLGVAHKSIGKVSQNKTTAPSPATLESLANTRATATAIWSSTIALILKDKGECKLHGLKRCAMP